MEVVTRKRQKRYSPEVQALVDREKNRPKQLETPEKILQDHQDQWEERKKAGKMLVTEFPELVASFISLRCVRKHQLTLLTKGEAQWRCIRCAMIHRDSVEQLTVGTGKSSCCGLTKKERKKLYNQSVLN